MKKLAILLCVCLLLPSLLLTVNADTAQTEFKFGIHAINGPLTEGQVLFMTSSYGKTVTDRGNNYSWAKVAVFEWDKTAEAYVLKSVDSSLGSGMQKYSVIPPNGFAISVNLGNDYSANGGINYQNEVATYVYNNIDLIPIGTKVYLTAIDIASGTFEYTGNPAAYYTSDFVTNGFINVTTEKPENCYEPLVDDMLESPVINNTESLYTLGDITISWNEIENASDYYVSVCDSTINANGPSLISEEISETSITIPADKLSTGSKYTARIYATDGYDSSIITEYTFVVCSERAINNKFKDKTIVAFGDSITQWTGWVSMLYGELGTEVINAGIAGNTTEDALKRIATDVLAKKPDLTIINFGMNDQSIYADTLQHIVPIEQYEANYRKIIEKVQKTGSKIILVAVHDACKEKHGSPNPFYDRADEEGVTYIDRYNEVVKKLATEYNLGFLDINALAQDILYEISLDGVHLNSFGQKKYCEWISDYCFEYVDSIGGLDKEESKPEEISEQSSPNESDSNGDIKTTAIVIIILFAGISVFGVMFIKLIKKNK